MWHNLLIQPLFRFSVLISFVALATFTTTESIHAQESNTISDSVAVAKIQLTNKFLRSTKFVFGESKPQRVHDWTGLNFRPEFQEVISLHPAALEEARRAQSYDKVKFFGTLAIAGLSIKAFMDIKKRGEEDLIEEWYDLLKVEDFIPLAFVTAVTIASSMKGYDHVKEGVKIFNEMQDSNPKSNSSTNKRYNNEHGELKLGLNLINSDSESLKRIDSNKEFAIECFLAYKF